MLLYSSYQRLLLFTRQLWHFGGRQCKKTVRCGWGGTPGPASLTVLHFPLYHFFHQGDRFFPFIVFLYGRPWHRLLILYPNIASNVCSMTFSQHNCSQIPARRMVCKTYIYKSWHTGKGICQGSWCNVSLACIKPKGQFPTHKQQQKNKRRKRKKTKEEGRGKWKRGCRLPSQSSAISRRFGKILWCREQCSGVHCTQCCSWCGGRDGGKASLSSTGSLFLPHSS